MVRKFDIRLSKTVVGTAAVEKQGLYYHVWCRCSLEQNALYRVLLVSGGKHLDLGTCLREGEEYVINTRVPAKQIYEDISFRLVEKGENPAPFYPIVQGHPFLYLESLPNAKLVINNGTVGITCQE